MKFTKQQIEALSGPLDRRFTREAPPGKHGGYIPTHHAISEANRIFGHDGWSYSVNSIREVYRDIVTTNNNRKQFRCGHIAVVTVFAGGKFNQDAGAGSGACDPIAAHEEIGKSVKSAVSDGIKRCLKSFGNPLGLALYDATNDYPNIRDNVFDGKYLGHMGEIVDEIGDEADFGQEPEEELEAAPEKDPSIDIDPGQSLSQMASARGPMDSNAQQRDQGGADNVEALYRDAVSFISDWEGRCQNANSAEWLNAAKRSGTAANLRRWPELHARFIAAIDSRIAALTGHQLPQQPRYDE